MRLNSKSKLEDSVRGEIGGIVAGAIDMAAMPVCAYFGSYIGEGIGYVRGNMIDFIPYVNDVAPWLAERAGLINNAENTTDLNENLYQTSGAIAGFWGGLLLPWKVIAAAYKDD